MIETNEKLNVHGGWREEDGKITGIISLLKKKTGKRGGSIPVLPCLIGF